MMRLNISQVVDGINYHAEVEGIDEAEQFLAFLNKKATDAMDSVVLPILPPFNFNGLGKTVAGLVPAATTTTATSTREPLPSVVKPDPVFTRENLQPLVVSLAKERERFTGILNSFGVARFRDLPDEKLQAFGEACQAVAA